MQEKIERPPLTGYYPGLMGAMSSLETRTRWQIGMMNRHVDGGKVVKSGAVTHLRLVGDDDPAA